jgi:uncharacterized protein YndB with AHSA1/START domain/ketosteroid isomerase-like protein
MKKSKMLSAILSVVVLSYGARTQAEVKLLAYGGYSVELEVVLPAAPDTVFDAATGDITGWWDHSFSEHPKKLYIEAKPGGGFYEIFDEAGNGVLHATVIYADRGKMLRFSGPLGFSGNALDSVVTYQFKPEGTGTRMHVSCNLVGQISSDEAQTVDQVWHHFIAERLKAYIESGAYLKKPTTPGAAVDLMQQIVAQEHLELDAIKAGSLQAFADLLADDAVFVEEHGPDGKSAVVAHTANFKLKDYSMGEVKLVTLSPTSGVIIYKLTETVAGGKKDTSSEVYVSALWTQRNGKWVCVFSQESVATK